MTVITAMRRDDADDIVLAADTLTVYGATGHKWVSADKVWESTQGVYVGFSGDACWQTLMQHGGSANDPWDERDPVGWVYRNLVAPTREAMRAERSDGGKEQDAGWDILVVARGHIIIGDSSGWVSEADTDFAAIGVGAGYVGGILQYELMFGEGKLTLPLLRRAMGVAGSLNAMVGERIEEYFV